MPSASRPSMSKSPPILVLTQGDPAGVGPEILCKMLARPPAAGAWRPLVIVERAAIESVRESVRRELGTRLTYLRGPIGSRTLEDLPDAAIAAVDPVGVARRVRPGTSSAADAAGAIAALDCAIDLVLQGPAQALVTLPVSKESIAHHHLPGFLGHTEYLAAKAGLERYGRDYLMTFLAPDLRVALLTTHVPLRRAIAELSREQIVEALALLHREAGRRIVVAGLNPHAGESGLIGDEESRVIGPAVAEARRSGIDVVGPESPDSLFARARKGEFDWVLALYHDQGLIAVKTAAFGTATNWTLGLPFLRTSVDHGTAFDIAGLGLAEDRPLRAVIETTLQLLSSATAR